VDRRHPRGSSAPAILLRGMAHASRPGPGLFDDEQRDASPGCPVAPAERSPGGEIPSGKRSTPLIGSLVPAGLSAAPRNCRRSPS